MPAGSLINCTVSETKLSSKTTAIGDPVLCQASITTRNGSARLPFNTYLEGRFEDYKDPGPFCRQGMDGAEVRSHGDRAAHRDPRVGKSGGCTGLRRGSAGKNPGKGTSHARHRGVVIPILWPIDLLNLPRRGPRPTLKTETRLTLKVMDDMEVPITEEPDRDPSGLYRREPSAYDDAPQDEPQPQVAQDDASLPAAACVSTATAAISTAAAAVSAAATVVCSTGTGSSLCAGDACLHSTTADQCTCTPLRLHRRCRYICMVRRQSLCGRHRERWCTRTQSRIARRIRTGTEGIRAAFPKRGAVLI